MSRSNKLVRVTTAEGRDARGLFAKLRTLSPTSLHTCRGRVVN